MFCLHVCYVFAGVLEGQKKALFFKWVQTMVSCHSHALIMGT